MRTRNESSVVTAAKKRYLKQGGCRDIPVLSARVLKTFQKHFPTD